LGLFNWLIPSGLPFLNIFFVLDAYGVSIYIAHHLEKLINNMGQICGREKHFHVHTTLEPFSSHNIIPK
jgi:hypothetical protein